MVYTILKEEEEINSNRAKFDFIKYLFFDYYNKKPRLKPSIIVQNVAKDFYEKTNTEITAEDFKYVIKNINLNDSLKKPYWAILSAENSKSLSSRL